MGDNQIKRNKLVVTALVPESINRDGKSGGAVRLHKILKRLGTKGGMKITIICTPFMRGYFEQANISAEYEIIKTKSKFRNLAGLCFKSALIIIKFILSSNPKKIASNDENIFLYASSDLFWEVIPAYFFKIKKSDIEWVQVIHHIYPNWKKRPGNKITSFFGYYLQRFSFWLISKKADKIIVVNKIVKENLVQMGFSENKIFVSSNGVDTDYFENIEKVKLEYDGIFLGRLSHSKGINDLIDIWNNVCRELPRAKIAIIGGGSEETKNFLMKKIASCGLQKNMDLLGFLEDRKAYSILKSGKVFLFPSHEEGWGIAIAEAMALGVPGFG